MYNTNESHGDCDEERKLLLMTWEMNGNECLSETILVGIPSNRVNGIISRVLYLQQIVLEPRAF